MSLKRVGVLLGKELLRGPKNFIFVWAVVAPVVISLVLSLIFGTLFSEKPRLGIVDSGSSQLVADARELTSVVTREYGNVPEMKQAVESGALDMGIVLPEDFDGSLIQGKKTGLTAYIWGQSLAKNRTILGATIANLARGLAKQEVPVEIEAITLGNGVSAPWNERLLPLIVLMAVFLGGFFLPATSVINEKEKKTLQALLVTPTTAGDVFLAKGLLGLILSLFMGIVILILNQAFGAEPALLALVLGLGAIMAVALGLLCGALMKDITSLFTVWKLGGILLFAPALVYLFPQIPEGFARVMPTYYVIQPIVEISQQGGSWPDIATNVLVLVAFNLILVSSVAFALRKTTQFAV
ncbi:MAG: ABC transporter permease [Chloroflexota bacterium]